VIRKNEMHFWIQHNEISKTHLFRFLPQKKSFYLQASVISRCADTIKFTRFKDSAFLPEGMTRLVFVVALWNLFGELQIKTPNRLLSLQAQSLCPKEYEGCPESIQPFWISREPFAWPWCNLAASQRRPYCASVNSHSPRGASQSAVRRRVLYDRRIYNDRANISANLHQCVCPFYGCRAGFLFLSKHHITQVCQPPSHPRFGSLRLHVHKSPQLQRWF